MKPFQINKIKLVSTISMELDVQYRELHGEGLEVESRHLNSIITAANNIIEEFTRERNDAKPGMGLRAWLASDDTGLSSLWMARTLCPGGIPISHSGYYYPHDSGDFKRCALFLQAVTDRKSIHHMADTGPEWKALADNWDELTALYCGSQFQQLGARIRELTEKQ